MRETKYSFLERSLSLSCNGGIYYKDGAEPDKRTAVLLVGLGGTGADALLRIKDQVKTRMILPSDKRGAPIAEQPENIGFLEIDADDSVQKERYGTARSNTFEKEFCDISLYNSGQNIPDILNNIMKAKKEGEECWQWVSEGVRNFMSGYANFVRQTGRVCLMYNIKKVISMIREKIESIWNGSTDKIMIYIFTGISGSTGSGIFIDAAYILRKLAQEYTQDVTVTGYLVMPDVNEKRGGHVKSLRANGFSSLKELDYWMSIRESNDIYYQKFPGEFTLKEQLPPFDFCYLMNAIDSKGNTFSYDEVLQTIANSVMMFLTDDTGAMQRLIQIITMRMLYSSETKEYPACYGYQSVGIQEIKISYTRMTSWLMAKVFENLEEGMFKNRPSEKLFNKSIHEDLEISIEKLRNELGKGFIESELVLDGREYKYEDIWLNKDPYKRACARLGNFQISVTRRTGELPEHLEKTFQKFVKTNLKDNKTGPFYLQYFMKSQEPYCLYDMLYSVSRDCRAERNICMCKSTELAEKIEKIFEEGKEQKSPKQKKRILKEYCKAVESWYKNETEIFLNEKIEEVLEAMIERLDAYYENLLRPLTNIFLCVQEVLEDNMEYIKTHPDKKTDVLIQQMEAEITEKDIFKTVADKFCESMSANIRKWIGIELENVTAEISADVDIQGALAEFTAENFGRYLSFTIEDAMRAEVQPGESIEANIEKNIEKLLKDTSILYSKNRNLANEIDGNWELWELHIPERCKKTYSTAEKYIKKHGLQHVLRIKEKKESDRISILKCGCGYPLYANNFIREMEMAYEQQLSCYRKKYEGPIHLNPEWAERLPSPNIELAWSK